MKSLQEIEHINLSFTGNDLQPAQRVGYKYMPQLKAMASKSPEIPESHPNLRQKTQTPLQVAAWEAALRSHPDTEFADYIWEGIQWGFHIGYDYTCSPAHSNLPSAREHPEVITKYLMR